MRVLPYLNYAGKAEMALNFYANALDGEIGDIMRFGDNSFPGLPEHMKDWVLHSELRFKGGTIYISDTFEPEKVSYGNAYTVHVDCDSKEEIENLFAAMKEGGQVIDDLADTFWGAIFGSLIDQFGIQWSFNYQK